MDPKNQMRIREAVGALQTGQLPKAEKFLKEVLQNEPSNIAALEILGLVKASQGLHAEAANYLKKSAHINPHNFSTQYNLAKALSECNNNLEAIPHHELAIKLAPNNPEAWMNYGKSLASMNSHEKALQAFSKALDLNPQYFEAMHNLGSTFSALKEHRKALETFDKILSVLPSHIETLTNKGLTLYELKRFDEALNCYDKVIEFNPNFSEAWSNKGNVLWSQRKFDEAFVCISKAIEINPQVPLYWHNLGVNFNSLKLYKDALLAYDKVLSIDPDFPYLMGTWLHTKMLLADWSHLDDDLKTLEHKIGQGKKVATPFSILGLSTSESINQEVAKIQIQTRFPFNPILGPLQAKENIKIKLGYFSADFKTHAVAALIANLIEAHDRSSFEVIGFSYGETNPNDHMRERLSRAFDQFVDIRGKSDAEVALLARELGIDVAIDLGGHTADARTGIFAFRAAPVQVNYLGYPGTLGADYFDYIIADKILIPKANEEFFTEKIAFLPDTYQPNDRKREIPQKQFTRTELGLPEDGFIYCCFNNNYKITPQTLDSWCRILQSVPNSVLWLFEDNQVAAPNLLIEIGKRGVDPGRLLFAPRVNSSEHLARHQVADLFIDTLPYNAHTTASDALWAGLPVLTLLGSTFAGRVAGSLLNAIGLNELIANTQNEYESLAIELGNNAAKLKSIKQKLIGNRLTMPLFDIETYTRNIEKAYQVMHEHYESKQIPQSFEV